ncbi:MAG: ATP-binding cassette domain-containing protein [Oscillospiraceae bacterium]|nr:ATP-binding cassette domain-containing protein [Oscillospiraceae bacterium]
MNIRANNVTLSISGRKILSNVTLLAEGGKITALTGKSGSGKTTLLNCLGLIHPIDSGEILVDNTNAARWSDRQRSLFWRQSASFIYQDYGIIEDYSVSFNVCLKKFGFDQHRINEVLKKVGLEGREKERAMVLSGGEKQRLGIARAIYKNSSVIFADEPTASLDEANRSVVISLLRDCANRGVAIILATHDERLVEKCNTVVSLDKSEKAVI